MESVLASWGEAEPLADPIPRFSDYVHSTVVPCSGDEAKPGESHCAIVLDQSLAVNSRFPCDFTWYVVSRDYDEKQRQIARSAHVKQDLLYSCFDHPGRSSPAGFSCFIP
jgi:hypothetical protein